MRLTCRDGGISSDLGLGRVRDELLLNLVGVGDIKLITSRRGVEPNMTGNIIRR